MSPPPSMGRCDSPGEDDLENKRDHDKDIVLDLCEDEVLEFYRQDSDDMNVNYTSRAFEDVPSGGVPYAFRLGLSAEAGDAMASKIIPPVEESSVEEEVCATDFCGRVALISEVLNSSKPAVASAASKHSGKPINVNGQPAASTSTTNSPPENELRNLETHRKRLDVMSYGMKILQAAAYEQAEHMKADQERTFSTRHNRRDRIAVRAAREVSNTRKRMATELREALEGKFGDWSRARVGGQGRRKVVAPYSGEGEEGDRRRSQHTMKGCDGRRIDPVVVMPAGREVWSEV